MGPISLLKITTLANDCILYCDSTYATAGEISQGRVATRLECDGIFNDHLIANLLQSIPVKQF